MSPYVNFWVDDIYTSVPRTFTVLQACSSAGVEVPRFCYHEKLSIAGNCRMCLVEVNNSKKLVASCAVPVSENLKIYTNNLRVKKARESVLEFLLANHPLDCPICDQGGECDLQDITVSFGSDRGRFYELEKRAVEDKYCGPLIKTVMTRCIHCTRCIRFISEVSGYPDLGTTGRGTRMEVGTYITKALMDELSSNIIDLCPVGALTSKPYSFTSRPWELNSVESIDVFDVLCSNIRLSVYGNKIKRILPRINEKLNEDWLSNKTRFIYDSFDLQRISTPLLNLSFIFSHKLSLWTTTSWKQILISCIYFLNKFRFKFVFGPHLDLETLNSFKLNFSRMGVLNSNASDSDYSSSFFSALKVKEIEKYSTFFSINAYLRNEVPLLNTRVRKSNNYFMSSFKFFSIGVGLNYFTYPVKVVSNNTNSLNKFLSGKHFACRTFVSLQNRFIVFYKNGFNNFFTKNFISLLNPFFVKIDLSVSSLAGSYFGLKLLDFSNSIDYTIYSVGFETSLDYIPLIYQGHHGNPNTSKSAVIMPTVIFTEKSSTYLNLEGLLQKTHVAVSHDKIIKKDNEVFKALSDFSHFWGFGVKKINFCSSINYTANDSLPTWLDGGLYYSNINVITGQFKNYLFSVKVLNYYWNDIFSQNSKIMAKCASIIFNNNNSYK